MNKLSFVLLLAVLSAVPISAYAQSCIWLSCNYVTDGSFNSGGTYWNPSNVGFGNVATDCGTSNIAYMQDSGTISQTFYIDGAGNSFELDLHAYLEDDTDNWWDELTINVHNDDTHAYETFYLHGSSYDTDCNLLSYYPLSNDYSDSHVTVTISSSYLNLGTWQIDNVAFWVHGF
jgi:hypothetical protein